MAAAEPDERFSTRSSPRPLVEAVTAYCQSSGRSLDEMQQLTPQQIFELAAEHYGEPLPEFWRIWQDWHASDDIEPMGDL